jgi:type IV pilus biogenesis protein CpaD/CtpE
MRRPRRRQVPIFIIIIITSCRRRMISVTGMTTAILSTMHPLWRLEEVVEADVILVAVEADLTQVEADVTLEVVEVTLAVAEAEAIRKTRVDLQAQRLLCNETTTCRRKYTVINIDGGGLDADDKKGTTASHFPWNTRAA